MKHTNFRWEIQAMKRHEVAELKLAIKAHGGSYSWWDEENGFQDDEDHPIIAVNVTGMFPNPTDVEIRRVEIVNDTLMLVGEDKETGCSVDFTADDIFVGHIGYIIDLIPVTEAVDDVTIPQ